MSLQITALAKVFLKNSVVSKNTKDFKGKRRQSTVMFLRAPKHFKAGKQFINYFKNTATLRHQQFFLNTKSFLFLSSKQLYVIYSSYLYKNSLPELKINRVTYKFSLVVKI